MFVRGLEECEVFEAGDKTRLRELLHPYRDQVGLSYSLAHAMLPPGAASLPHRLKGSEAYYLLSGTGEMLVGGERRQVRSGDTILVPPGAVQHIVNTGSVDLVFLCIVDPPWRAEDEEVLG